MGSLSVAAAMLLVGTFIVPIVLAAPSARNDVASPAPAAAGSRAEPEYNGSGAHERSAVYDFSNTYMFSRWSIVMETGRARLMKNLHYQNESWKGEAALPDKTGRASMVTVWDSTNGRVMLLGGYAWNSSMADRLHDRPVLVYDPANGTWADLGPSRIPAGSAGVWDPVHRCALVCGGTDSASGREGVSNRTWAFFPANATWVRLADMPRERHGQSAVWDPEDGLMLVFGGTNGTGYYNDVWSFDHSRNLWTNLTIVSDEYPLTRAYTSAVWSPKNREMLIHGGFNTDITFLSTWAFSFQNATWIHRTSAPYARYCHAAGYDPASGTMMVFGAGEYDYTDVWNYDIASDSWGPGRTMPGPLRTAAGGVFDPVFGRFLVFGGRDASGECLDETWSFSPGTLRWSYFSPGHMQPPALDLGPDAHSVERVLWTSLEPTGTCITLRARLSADNSSWSSWETVENGGAPYARGRYLQWNMTFSASTDLRSTPVLSGVRFDYLVNRAPSADAGSDLGGSKRQPVPLSGGGADPDGDPITFNWSRATALAGAFDDISRPDASYTPLVSGVHRLALVADDSFSLSPAAYVNVTVLNRPPAAMAGLDGTGYRGEFIDLHGQGSDPDGDPLWYNWTQLGGPSVGIAGPQSPRASFVPPRSGNYTFRFEVSDGEDASYATVNVTVLNRPPVARLEASPGRAGVNERIDFTAALSYDPDGNITKYLIDFGDGNDTGWTTRPDMGYYYTAPGAYSATALAMDDEGAVSERSGALTITVANALPVVNISVAPERGDFRTVFLFSVSASSYDPDGSIVSYSWRFGDGATEGGSTASHNYSRPGTYVVVLRATDDLGGYTERNLSVTVANLAPVITSTSPARLLEMRAGARATLTVAASDPEGGPLGYSWRVDNASAGENNNSFVFRPGAKGQYRVSVTVSDGEGSVSHEWGVTVTAAGGGGGEEGDVTPITAGIIVAVVILVVIIALLARKRR